jgi:hypothetical protein
LEKWGRWGRRGLVDKKDPRELSEGWKISQVSMLENSMS